MWSFLPVGLLVNWQPYEPNTASPLRSGARVALVKRGTVSYERSGFARVRWDDGVDSDWWIADLVVLEGEEAV